MPILKPLLIGESNPYSGDPEHALLPWPNGSAGHRLANYVLGTGNAEYLRRFERRNLLEGDWDWVTARFAAAAIGHSRPILLGAKVAGAFWLKFEPLAIRALGSGRMALMLPHPSGLNHYYNEERNIRATRQAVADFERRYCK